MGGVRDYDMAFLPTILPGMIWRATVDMMES